MSICIMMFDTIVNYDGRVWIGVALCLLTDPWMNVWGHLNYPW